MEMKLCYYNDCMAGEYRLALCCVDCDIEDCPERCVIKNSNCCFFMKDAEEYDKDTGETVKQE